MKQFKVGSLYRDLEPSLFKVLEVRVAQNVLVCQAPGSKHIYQYELNVALENLENGDFEEVAG